MFLCKTDIYSQNLSEKISLMVVDPFSVPFLYNLQHISLFFIHNSMKMTYDLFRASRVFFKNDPQCLACSTNSKIAQGFLWRRPLFAEYLSIYAQAFYHRICTGKLVLILFNFILGIWILCFFPLSYYRNNLSVKVSKSLYQDILFC